MRTMIRKLPLILVYGTFVVFIIISYCSNMETIDKPVYDYYLESFQNDTGASNAVTAIYLNYRIFDTIFEALLLLLSVIAVIHLSWERNDDEFKF